MRFPSHRIRRRRWYSAGTSRGLIEAAPTLIPTPRHPAYSAGTSRGLIEARSWRPSRDGQRQYSAGTSRGLIEATAAPSRPYSRPSIPRELPAASLKLLLRLAVERQRTTYSAGTSRGLIEARTTATTRRSGGSSIPRELPAASLKRVGAARAGVRRDCIPRELPAASLKRSRRVVEPRQHGVVFRGNFPRPH